MKGTLGKMAGTLEEQMGGRIACDKLGWMRYLLSRDKSQPSPLVSFPGGDL